LMVAAPLPAVGARVQIRGLQAKPELNGREARCHERKVDSGRWLVKLDDGTEFALKEANLLVLQLAQSAPAAAVGTAAVAPPPSGAAGSGGAAVGSPGARSSSAAAAAARLPTHLGPSNEVLQGLDQILEKIEPRRGSVCNAMGYCLDHGEEHAVAVARRLTQAFGKPKVVCALSVARLFVISDVLHNCRNGRALGAQQFRESFQELLPEACERLGKHWLLQTDAVEEWAGREKVVSQVFRAWDAWRVFPPLFTKGLTSLLFALVQDISFKEASIEPDELLRAKLVRWFSGIEQTNLPGECRARGLAGKSTPSNVCRARLCHFERYWHWQPGALVRLTGLKGAAHLNGQPGRLEEFDWPSARWKVCLVDGEVKSVKQENLLVVGDPPSESRGTGRGSAASSPTASTPPAPEPADTPGQAGPDGIDGDPLTAADLAAIAIEKAAEKEAAARERREGRRRRFFYEPPPKRTKWVEVK